MTTRFPTVILAATTLAACASGPSGPPPFDPVGTYEFTAVANGQSITGTMTIEADEDGYTGVIRNVTMPLPPAPITSVQVIDQLLTIQAAGPEGPLLIELAITDTGLEGTWAMGDGSGGFTAIKTG